MPQVTRRSPTAIEDAQAPFLPEPVGETPDAAAVREASNQGWGRVETAWGSTIHPEDRDELREIVRTYLSLALAVSGGPDEATVLARLEEIDATANQLMRLLQPPENPTPAQWKMTQRVWGALDAVTFGRPDRTGHHELWSALLSFGEVCRVATGGLAASDEFWAPNTPWQILVSQLASFSQQHNQRPTAHKGGVGDSKVLEWRPSAFVSFVWAMQAELPMVPFKLHQPYSLTACSSAVAKVLADWRAGQARA